MEYWLLVVIVALLDVCMYVRNGQSAQCECLCTSISGNRDVSISVSGDYCKEATFEDGNNRNCQAPCGKKWHVENHDGWCVCDTSPCRCPANLSGRSGLIVTCSCNSTENSIPTTEMSTPITEFISTVSRVYDQDRQLLNSTARLETLPPRKYNSVGVGLGVVFGLAAIITVVWVLIFFYRRHNEAIENQRKTPEIPVYASTQEGEPRNSWTAYRGSLDDTSYNDMKHKKISQIPQDSSQDSSTHYTSLQLNEEGVANGGYTEAESYLKQHNGHSTSGEIDHEYQGLYTEVSTPSPKEESIPRTDSEFGYSSPSSSTGDSLQPDIKLSGTEDTDSSEPYYIQLNPDNSSDDKSPCLSVPDVGIYNGSTSGDSGDYEQLQLNRLEEFPPVQNEVCETDNRGDYGIMVMENREADNNPTDTEYDRLDRGPLDGTGKRPLG